MPIDSILKKETITVLDISSEATVLTYSHPASAESVIVLPRVKLGDPNPIAGGGSYIISAKVDGLNVVPPSDIAVAAGQTMVVMQSRHLTLEPGDVLTITIIGLAGDTGISSESIVVDATPVRDEEFDQILTKIDDALGTGPTTVAVDHNFGGSDRYSYRTEQLPEGQGIADASIWSYLKTDYDAGRRSSQYVVASTTTDINGRWRKQMMLDPGTYKLLYFKTSRFGPDLADLRV